MDLSIERARMLLNRRGGDVRHGLGGVIATFTDGATIAVRPARFTLEYDWTVSRGSLSDAGCSPTAEEAAAEALLAKESVRAREAS